MTETQQKFTWLDWIFVWIWWVFLNSAAWAVSWAAEVIGLLLVGVVVGFAQRIILRNFLAKTRAWVIVTGIVLGITLPSSMFLFFMESARQAVPVGAVTGAIVGFAQRLVLYNHIEGARWWTPFSILGLSAGFYLGMLTFYQVFAGSGSVLYNALVGAIIGSVYGVFTGIALVLLLQEGIVSDAPNDSM
jgi:hypothetical protein